MTFSFFHFFHFVTSKFPFNKTYRLFHCNILLSLFLPSWRRCYYQRDWIGGWVQRRCSWPVPQNHAIKKRNKNTEIKYKFNQILQRKMSLKNKKTPDELPVCSFLTLTTFFVFHEKGGGWTHQINGAARKRHHTPSSNLLFPLPSPLTKTHSHKPQQVIRTTSQGNHPPQTRQERSRILPHSHKKTLKMKNIHILLFYKKTK